MSNSIKIAIAEDHTIFRTMLAKFVDGIEMYKVVISASNGLELLNALEKTSIDILILDLNMPVLDGEQTLSLLRKKYGQSIRVIILSMHKVKYQVEKYIRLGANAFLNKGCSEEELIGTIEMLLNEKESFFGGIADKSQKEQISYALKSEKLTEREIEICRLICMGNSCPGVAKILNLSIRTIENHKARIFKKMSVKSPTEMMEKAIISGYYCIQI